MLSLLFSMVEHYEEISNNDIIERGNKIRKKKYERGHIIESIYS